MSYPPQGGGWQEPQPAWQQGQPGGWQDPAGGTYPAPASGQPQYADPAGQPQYGDPGGQPQYGDPASGQPAYIDPVSGQPTSYPGYAAQPAYPASPGYGYGYAPAYPGYGAPLAGPRTNGLSIASLVVSLVAAAGLACYGVGGLIGIVGAILGHVSRSQINRRGEQGGGMALAGIIVGWIATGLAVAIIIGLIVLFYNIDRAAQNANYSTP